MLKNLKMRFEYKDDVYGYSWYSCWIPRSMFFSSVEDFENPKLIRPHKKIQRKLKLETSFAYRELKESMTATGKNGEKFAAYLPFPIFLAKQGKRLSIVDGQHRMYNWRERGFSHRKKVMCMIVVCPDDKDLADMFFRVSTSIPTSESLSILMNMKYDGIRQKITQAHGLYCNEEIKIVKEGGGFGKVNWSTMFKILSSTTHSLVKSSKREVKKHVFTSFEVKKVKYDWESLFGWLNALHSINTENMNSSVSKIKNLCWSDKFITAWFHIYRTVGEKPRKNILKLMLGKKDPLRSDLLIKSNLLEYDTHRQTYAFIQAFTDFSKTGKLNYDKSIRIVLKGA